MLVAAAQRVCRTVTFVPVRTYLLVVREPGVAAVLATNVIARLPVGMLGLTAMLLMLALTDSYALAGAVVAFVAIGQAASGPLMSWVAMRCGVRPTILVSAALCAGATLALGLVGDVFVAAMALAFLSGLATPPILAIARATYPAIVVRGRVSVVLALDGSAQEAIWISAPVVVVSIASVAGPRTALALIAVLTVVGCGLFVLLLPDVWRPSHDQGTEERAGAPSGRRSTPVILNRLVVTTTVIGALLIGGCAAAETTVLAVIEDRASAGIVLAVFSAGSLVGGLVFAGLRASARGLLWRLALVACGLVMAVFAITAVGMATALFIGGLGVASALALRTSLIAAALPRNLVATASGWLSAGQLAGAGAGAALAGALIEVSRSTAASLAAVSFVVAAMVVTVAASRHLMMTSEPAMPAPARLADES
jgi:MFS family permease